MPFSRRTGKRYAAGSSSTAPPEYPRVCDLCHERILVSKTGFEQRADIISGRWVFRSRHVDCPPFRSVV